MIRELYIEQERPERNRVNGQFLKGHVPHNKGKKWSEYLDPKIRKKIRYNLRHKLRGKGNPHLTEYRKQPVYALDDEGNILGWFESSEDASRKLGICGRNIRSVLNGTRKHAGGFRWIKAEKKA